MQRAERRNGIAQHTTQLNTRLIRGPRRSEIDRVKIAKFGRQVSGLSLTQDRHNNLLCCLRMLPLGADVVRLQRSRTDHNENAVNAIDRCADLVKKGERSAWHRLAVEPDGQTI